jgi:hypothetical protein
MLADKTLLSMTLAVTFTSGLAVGFAAHGAQPARRGFSTDPAVVCAPELKELKDKGYDDGEMAEAKESYAVWLQGYERWWTEFLDVQSKNLDLHDKKLEKRLDALSKRHAERAGTK